MAVHEAPVVWDLSDLYSGPDDPALAADNERLRVRAARFEERFRGRIASEACDAATLREAMDEYEAIQRAKARPLSFASLMFSADTSDPARGALLQKMQEEGTAISTRLLFFPLEVGRMPEETFRQLAEHPLLADYRHYLEHTRATAAHDLTEPEEKVVAELSNTGVSAFVRLFSEINSRAVYRVRRGRDVEELTQSQTLALLSDPDRGVRQAAAEAVTETLKGQAHGVTFIFNTLLQEKATMDRLRGYEYPEQARHEDNELSPEVVRNVVEVAAANYDVVQDYYRLKRRLLKLETLTHYDRYAPLAETVTEIPFSQARSMVLEAFGEFSPSMQEMAEPFFSRRWIDAEVRPGKRGGAFCSYLTPDLHPYVFMNYTSRARDVMTLAHELGHALHGILAGRHHYLHFYPSLPLAETASVFGEMLVFERLQQGLQDPRERLALLCGKIEDTMATVFRQVSMFRFEQAAHRARRAEGELTTERYNDLWQRSMQEMFGDALTLEEEHRWWWLYIPHVFASPFYVYAYAFGELLVLSLYARYRREGQPFVQRYFDLLAAGGSRKPEAMLREMEIDILQPEFWQGGADLIRKMVQEAGALAEQVRA
jgi:oligoendopeptidase F